MTGKFVVAQLTEDASARGRCMPVAGNNFLSCCQFLGIPYAEQPVNERRFKPPETLQLWSGNKDCCSYGPIAPQDIAMVQRQMFFYKVPTNMDEACLYLNVFTPTLEASAKLPVMFWIHGGAFIQGFSNFYDGSYLASTYNVVVVTINYRLGLFGFMSTGDDEVRGNMGLLDQVQALKWVKDYIHSFGGDPNNVTIFGESAGAICISFHIVSPMSRGLFHKAICQSGVSVHPGSVWSQANSGKYMKKRLSKLGFSGQSGADMVEFMKNFDAIELIEKFGFGFQAVLDGQFLPDYPVSLFKQGLFNTDVDVVMGFNSHEGAMFMFEMIKEKTELTIEKMTGYINTFVKHNFFRYHPRSSEIVEVLFNLYKPATDDPTEVLQSIVDLYGDLLFVAPTFFCADLYSSRPGIKQPHMYEFRFRPFFSRYPDWIQTDHGEEIPYVFGKPFLNETPAAWPDEDKAISAKIMKLWSDFAKFGSFALNKSNWPTSVAGSYFDLSSEEVKKSLRPEKMKMWISIFNETFPAAVSKY